MDQSLVLTVDLWSIEAVFTSRFTAHAHTRKRECHAWSKWSLKARLYNRNKKALNFIKCIQHVTTSNQFRKRRCALFTAFPNCSIDRAPIPLDSKTEVRRHVDSSHNYNLHYLWNVTHRKCGRLAAYTWVEKERQSTVTRIQMISGSKIDPLTCDTSDCRASAREGFKVLRTHSKLATVRLRGWEG